MREGLIDKSQLAVALAEQRQWGHRVVQGTLSNIAAGVMLLIFRPFRLGEYVDVAGIAGTVADIGLFTITMNTPDNVQITVPNSAVYGQTIKNYSVNETRRNDILVGISYDDDIGVAMDAIKGVLAADDRVLEQPEPLVAVVEMGDSSINIAVRPWSKRTDYWSLRCDLLRALKEQVEAAGCSIPYHGSRTAAGSYLGDRLRALQAAHGNFQYIPCISGGAAPEGSRRGGADDVAFTEHADLKKWRVFLCGNPQMVYRGRDRAAAAGARTADIYADPYELKDLRKTPRS